MSKVLRLYKYIVKKVYRLPVDVFTLNLAKSHLKEAFINGKITPSYSVPNKKRYDNYLRVIDGVLEENYKLYPKLLDLIYKDAYQLPSWATQLLNTRYSLLKKVWPETHLLYEFGRKKNIEAYNKELHNLQPKNEDFILMELMGLPQKLVSKAETILPLRRNDQRNDDLEEVVQKAREFHKFLIKNESNVSDIKIRPFEVIYEPNSFAYPPSVPMRENRIRVRVNYIKNLIKNMRPLKKEHCMHINEVASGRHEAPLLAINPNFERYLIRKKKSGPVMSILERKYLRQKELVPNDRNIRYLYKRYASKQFFVDDDDQYHVNPARFYD